MLKQLEYRGYDSAGIALINNDGAIEIIKKKGRVAMLEEASSQNAFEASTGIGHTRWATHGIPSDLNAHPFFSKSNRVAIVHNGIIENNRELKKELTLLGYDFLSDTDSEVISHLAEEYMKNNSVFDYKIFVSHLASKLKGAFATLLIFSDRPNEIIGLRVGSPLNFVLGEGLSAISSDIASLVSYNKTVYILRDFQAVRLNSNTFELCDFEGQPATPNNIVVDWDIERAEKQGFQHFMRKEINEQPDSINNLSVIVKENANKIISFMNDVTPDSAFFIACGSASYSCVFASILARHWQLDKRVQWEIGSEFRYKPHPIGPKTLMVTVSQSGETADTIGAINKCKENGAKVLAFVNTAGSSIDMISDLSINLAAGPEIAVPSTKAVINQFLATSLIVSLLQNTSPENLASWANGTKMLARAIKEIILNENRFAEIARIITGHQSMFVLGRGLDYPIAMETALKLKETGYLHGEAMFAGEFKHGPISLIEYGMPVICLLGDSSVRSKTISNIEEVKARGAQIIIIDPHGETNDELSYLGDYLRLMKLPEPFDVILQLAVVQLIAYHVGIIRNIDVDKPRNLAKSVTVE
jgi:glucosamine--fructose-6-phosphate aminotransferase (isomerizing)